MDPGNTSSSPPYPSDRGPLRTWADRGTWRTLLPPRRSPRWHRGSPSRHLKHSTQGAMLAPQGRPARSASSQDGHFEQRKQRRCWQRLRCCECATFSSPAYKPKQRLVVWEDKAPERRSGSSNVRSKFRDSLCY